MSIAAKQFRHELEKLINRCCEESDLTIGECIQVLETEKLDLYMAIRDHAKENDDEESEDEDE